MIESGITTKGQTTLPKPVRDALGLKAGDRVRYAILDGKVMLTPVRPARRLFGMLKYDGPPVTLEEIDAAIKDRAVQRFVESVSTDHDRD